MLKGANIKIELNQLTCHQKVEKWGKAEPYLWVIFFKMDGNSVDITSEFKLKGRGTFYFAPGSHGNLGLEGALIHEKAVSIPKSIGQWVTYLEPFHIPYFEQKAPAIVGAIAVLMEQNNVSYKGAEAGHQALNKKVQEAVNAAMRSFDPRVVDINDVMGAIKKYFEQKVEDFTATIQDDIIAAIRAEQKLIRNLWTLLNPDNLIGYHVWNFNQQELQDSENATIHFSNRWQSEAHGDWEIAGKISVLKDVNN